MRPLQMVYRERGVAVRHRQGHPSTPNCDQGRTRTAFLTTVLFFKNML
jgi:hypothetical protein